MKKKYFFYLFLISFFLPPVLISQIDTAGIDYKLRITPGKQYKVNWINQLFSGKHWRDLWITEIDADVIDLNKFAGGLIPLKQGGGLQTKSLRLRGNDDNEYKFRSIDKFPYKSLPPEWQNSYYAKLLQDQVSIGLPVSSLVVYPMMTELGILCVKPRLVVMPDNDKLGIFKKDFGGVPGIIEINPRAGKKGINNFADADKIVNGFDIFKKVEKDNDEQVDQTEFLKARLFDIFIGDRDRHADQWQWAGFKKDGKRIWKPIPRDRDYAFGRYDGFFPWFSGVLAHSLVGFNYDIPQIEEITWTGRHLDRRFLNELDKPVWDSLAFLLTIKLTDDVLKNTIRQMPPEMYAKEGVRLFNMLKSRRSQMKKAANDFYKLYSDVVDVYGSDKKEYAEAEVLNEKEIEIRLYKKDKETGDKKGEPFYKRKFNTDYTGEVRLHLLDGDDYTIIKGDADNNILLRVISDKGKDELFDKSDIKIKVYDPDKDTKITTVNGVYFNDDKIEIPQKPIKKYEPSTEDRYAFWAFTPVGNYNTDDGLIIGGGPSYEQYGFRADPYLYDLQLTGAYATTAKDYEIKFIGDFIKLIHNSRTRFLFSASELDFNRYYGFGNETERSPQLAEQNFYKSNQKNIIIRPEVVVDFSKKIKLNFSATYRYSNVSEKNNSNNLVGEVKPYGFGKISGLGLTTGFTFDNVDNHLSPKKGIYSLVNFTYYPKLLDYKSDFSRIYADILGIYTVKTFTEITIMLKAGAEYVSGTYPFFEAATVGGTKNLRGYSRERFQGDAALFGQSELRIKIAAVDFFLPAILGVSGMSDAGRVFVNGNNSKKWHTTYGAGAWIEIVNTVVLNFLVARSPEATKYYFSFGLGF